MIPWTSGRPVYQDLYDQGTDHLGDLALGVGATATLPLTVGHERAGVLAVVLSRPHVWSATDRAVLETTARQLGLALEGSRAQRELGRTQHYLKVAVENAPLLLFATDARGVFALSEGRLLDTLDLKPGQAVGHAATTLFAHEPNLREGRRLGQALAGEETHDLMHFASRGVTLETWFTPVKNAAGEVTEVVGVSLGVHHVLPVHAAQRRPPC
nr:GAF domain-containing protein [Deinococcus aestuarii]